LYCLSALLVRRWNPDHWIRLHLVATAPAVSFRPCVTRWIIKLSIKLDSDNKQSNTNDLKKYFSRLWIYFISLYY
jgi:hypothetical protein